MNRFEAASDGELQSFADNQKSLNTQRSTKTTMCLLEQYKVEAFNYTNGFETMDRNNLVKLLKSFYQKIKKSDGEPYEPGSLRTMHYGVLRFFREQFQIEFSDSQTGEIVKHLGAVNKSLRKKGKGNLPNKSDALTNKETHLFFEGKAAGDHHPKALRNAIQVFSLILGRRGATEQRSFCFGDMIVIVINGHQFLTLNGERVSKSRQGEDVRDIRHGIGVLARLPNHPDKCPVKLFLEYSLKRPSDMKHPDTPMFLLSSRKAPSDFRKPFELNDIWYHSKAAGLNTLCKTTKTMVDILQMDVGNRKITNTSVRKMVVNTLGNKGVPHKRIMAYTGHKSSASLIHYDCLNCEEGTEISNLLLMGDAEYTTHTPPPILLSSPSDNLTPPALPLVPINTPARLSPSQSLRRQAPQGSEQNGRRKRRRVANIFSDSEDEISSLRGNQGVYLGGGGGGVARRGGGG